MLDPEQRTLNQGPVIRALRDDNVLDRGTVDALGERLKRECEALGAKFDQEIKALGIRLENMQRATNNTVADIHLNMDRLWDVTAKAAERIGATERYSKNMGECLQERLDESTQRLEESVMTNQRRMEERLSSVENDLLGKIDLQSRGLVREIEDLKQQIREVQQSRTVDPFSGMVPNNYPFGARHQSPQTPVTATSL